MSTVVLSVYTLLVVQGVLWNQFCYMCMNIYTLSHSIYRAVTACTCISTCTSVWVSHVYTPTTLHMETVVYLIIGFHIFHLRTCTCACMYTIHHIVSCHE